MAQWIRILPIQGTGVWSLVQEDSICLRATKPVSHSYWAHMLRLLKPLCPGAHALQHEEPPQWEARVPQLKSGPSSLQLEKAWAQQRRPSAEQNKQKEDVWFNTTFPKSHREVLFGEWDIDWTVSSYKCAIEWTTKGHANSMGNISASPGPSECWHLVWSCSHPSFHKVLENSRIGSKASLLLSPDYKAPFMARSPGALLEKEWKEKMEGGDGCPLCSHCVLPREL